MSKNKPLILVVNDDGIDSQGISFLIQCMRQIGDVYVVAPDGNRSGYSHSMTLVHSISIKTINKKQNEYMCSGTPVDCVKLALNKILPRLPDLCVSGINHGSNHSINGLYSGTLHAAMEATIQGVPSISFSHLSYDSNIDLEPFDSIIQIICKKVLDDHALDGFTLNINFPNVSYEKIKGLKICVPGEGVWKENFQLVKKIELEEHYVISGDFKSDKTNVLTDSWALENNFISLVPVGLYPNLDIDLVKLKDFEDVF